MSDFLTKIKDNEEDNKKENEQENVNKLARDKK